MDLGLLHQHGESMLHRKMTAAPAPLLQAVAPDHDGLVVAGEGLVPWDLAR